MRQSPFYRIYFFTSNPVISATAAHFKPLLHTWSLAVEEQFYILYPLVLWLALKFARALAAGAAGRRDYHIAGRSGVRYFKKAGCCVLSFSISCVGIIDRLFPRFGRDSKNFQWGPFRNAVTVLGIGLIGYAVIFFNADTPFPGFTALLPCVGAAFLLLGNGSGENYVGKILSAGPLVFVGLISYSLYLWHWPLLVFARLALLRPITPAEGAMIVLLSIAAATVSWALCRTTFPSAEPCSPADFIDRYRRRRRRFIEFRLHRLCERGNPRTVRSRGG